MPGDQALQLGHDSVVRTFVELEGDPPLGRGEAEVLGRSLGNCERRVDVYEGRSAPELERGGRSLRPELEKLGEVEPPASTRSL